MEGEELVVEHRTVSYEEAFRAELRHFRECIVDGKAPATVLVIAIQSVFFQCARALVRSKLWDPAVQLARNRLPSNGTILAAVSEKPFDGVAYDESQPARMKQTLY